MEIEILNPHAMKILISARETDSINSISKRIGLSYGWTYKWVCKLAAIGVFRITRTKLYLNKKNRFYTQTMEYIITNFSKDINFHYSVLGLFGVKYSFTSTDSVFIWTKGGYNIARYKDYYPVFIKIKKSDYRIFEEYCKNLRLKINGNAGIYYNVRILKDFEISYCNGLPVDSLETTIKFMKKYIYNFEPALEMIKEMYGKNIRVRYREELTNV